MSKTIEIEIPFSGFYESLHDDNLDQAIQDGFNYNYETGEDIELDDKWDTAMWNADINWEKIHRDYAKAYAEEFGSEFDLDVSFTDMTSPQFYNFKTDRIFVEVPIDQINKIRKEAEAHKDYAGYIRERFTSYSGFWSNFENDHKHEEWTREELEPVQYRAILDFWIEKISDAHEDWDIYLMDDFRGNGGISEIVNDAVELIEAELKKEEVSAVQ